MRSQSRGSTCLSLKIIWASHKQSFTTATLQGVPTITRCKIRWDSFTTKQLKTRVTSVAQLWLTIGTLKKITPDRQLLTPKSYTTRSNFRRLPMNLIMQAWELLGTRILETTSSCSSSSSSCKCPWSRRPPSQKGGEGRSLSHPRAKIQHFLTKPCPQGIQRSAVTLNTTLQT